MDVGNWSSLEYKGRHFSVADATVRFNFRVSKSDGRMELLDTGEKIYIVNDRVIDDLKAGLPVGHRNYEESFPDFGG